MDYVAVSISPVELRQRFATACLVECRWIASSSHYNSMSALGASVGIDHSVLNSNTHLKGLYVLSTLVVRVDWRLPDA